MDKNLIIKNNLKKDEKDPIIKIQNERANLIKKFFSAVEKSTKLKKTLHKKEKSLSESILKHKAELDYLYFNITTLEVILKKLDTLLNTSKENQNIILTNKSLREIEVNDQLKNLINNVKYSLTTIDGELKKINKKNFTPKPPQETIKKELETNSELNDKTQPETHSELSDKIQPELNDKIQPETIDEEIELIKKDETNS